jgi:CRP-like cAMP-binding protein
MDMSQTVSFFRDFSAPDIEEIRSLAKLKEYVKDELVFSEGDEANSFYIVDKGHVRVFYNKDGVKEGLCLLGENDYFGEMAIYNQDKRSASVEAIEDTVLLKIKKDEFLEFVNNHPVLAEKINKNLAVRNEELILRESLVDMTGVNSKSLHVSIKGDPSLRESAFVRERYESVVDKILDQLEPVLEDLVLNRCVYRLFINFNSGEIRTASVFDPFVEEVHTSDKFVDQAYVDRHFPKISYEEKSEIIKAMYGHILADEHFNQLPGHWKNIFNISHAGWSPIDKAEVSRVIRKLTDLRSIQNFYLRNFSISMIQDAIRMQFNCDGTHIVSAEDYQRFLKENLE